MNKQQSARLVGAISAAHPTKNIPAETVVVYASMLADLEFETAEQAVARCLRTITYWPSIAEIKDAYRAIVMDKQRALPPPSEPDVPALERQRNLAQINRWTAEVGWSDNFP